MLAITMVVVVGVIAGWMVGRVTTNGYSVTDHAEMVRLSRSFRYGCGGGK